jgi:ComF family protein
MTGQDGVIRCLLNGFMVKAGKPMNSWLAAFLDLLFPPRCPDCGTEMPALGEWCPDCLKHYQLNVTLDVDEQGLRYLDEVMIFADYSRAVRKLLQNLKFRHEKAAAQYLQVLLPCSLAKGLDTITAEYRPDLAVPVPVHSARLRQRGYNQTNLIFKNWAERQGLLWRDVLQRIKPTLPQYSLNPAERRSNIKDAFIVTRPEFVMNQSILLVDDIYTSGITLDECAHQLRMAGAKQIIGAVCASSAR